MSFLSASLDALGFQYFSSEDEYLLVFRGSCLDHHVMLRQGEAYLHGTCVLGRVGAALDGTLALRLLEWNSRHILNRLAIADGELLALAELPLQGLSSESVEELVLSLATTAEEFSRELLPLMLASSQPGAETPTEPGNSGYEAGSPPSRPATPAASDDVDIDWEAEDR